jgi:hypothetical protein
MSNASWRGLLSWLCFISLCTSTPGKILTDTAYCYSHRCSQSTILIIPPNVAICTFPLQTLLRPSSTCPSGSHRHFCSGPPYWLFPSLLQFCVCFWFAEKKEKSVCFETFVSHRGFCYLHTLRFTIFLYGDGYLTIVRQRANTLLHKELIWKWNSCEV